MTTEKEKQFLLKENIKTDLMDPVLVVIFEVFPRHKKYMYRLSSQNWCQVFFKSPDFAQNKVLNSFECPGS